MTPRIQELINDMFDTMYEANGVGLAAPQVGILKRIVVIDTTGEDPIVMINPRIIETSGEQTGGEGCLSVPGKTGTVTRPNYVKAIAFNENMEAYEIEATELLARAIAMKQIIWMVSCMCQGRRTADGYRRILRRNGRDRGTRRRIRAVQRSLECNAEANQQV